MKILFSRPDRIGDVILSLPTLQAWKKQFPNHQVGILVQYFLRQLLEGHPAIDFIVTLDHEDGKTKNASELTQELAALKLDRSVSLIPHYEVDRGLKRAKVPQRFGLRTKWFTYFLYTKSVRQKRSQVKKHEAEYNLDLARLAGLTFVGAPERP